MPTTGSSVGDFGMECCHGGRNGALEGGQVPRLGGDITI